MNRAKSRGRGPATGLLRSGAFSILPGKRWPKPGRKRPPMTQLDPDLEDRIQRAENLHRLRRRGTARVYRTLERLFFLAILLFTILAVRRFLSAVTPALLG